MKPIDVLGGLATVHDDRQRIRGEVYALGVPLRPIDRRFTLLMGVFLVVLPRVLLPRMKNYPKESLKKTRTALPAERAPVPVKTIYTLG